MKKVIAIYLILALLSSCNPIGPNANWSEFPQEMFNSYAPYQKEDVVVFTNGNDTMMYTVTYYNVSYQKEDEPCKCGHYEEATLNVEMQNDKNGVGYSLFISDRQELQCHIHVNGVGGDLIRTTEEIDKLSELLTPELIVCDAKGVEIVCITRDSGITRFVKDNVIWEVVVQNK